MMYTSTEQPEARDLAYWIAHTKDNPTAALIQSLHARVQELEKDAARYRVIRDPETTQDFSNFYLEDLDSVADSALAAAPQPPEAESMISSREVVSNPCSGVKVTRLNLSEAGHTALQSKASHIPEVDNP